ncbi:hypothetical protein [Bacillus cereus]|uniref:hypothetical protein n=1 Tax=Bacillus cereus TaxID=1396 RepID=UPI000BFBEFE4|nr:hypothetical protein [Bacillus cereus]PGR83710.1 hypothetical protein COC63_06900 [Bacillus cereus]
MREDTKTVIVHYFRQSGKFHSTEQKVVPSDWSIEHITEVLTRQRRYNTLDMVILDSGDEKNPYFPPLLVRAGEVEERKGFFG